MRQSTQDTQKKAREKILAQYKKKSEEILFRMYQVVTQTQRQIDDSIYRQTLANVKKL